MRSSGRGRGSARGAGGGSSAGAGGSGGAGAGGAGGRSSAGGSGSAGAGSAGGGGGGRGRRGASKDVVLRSISPAELHVIPRAQRLTIRLVLASVRVNVVALQLIHCWRKRFRGLYRSLHNQRK